MTGPATVTATYVRLPALDFLRWNTQVGKHIATYVAQMDVEGDDDARWSANVVLASSDLIDWAAAEYAAVEKSDRPALPTEVLNADGCRVFGRLTKAGWSGAALVLGEDPETARLVLRSLTAATGNPLGVYVSVRRSDEHTGSWDLTLEHEEFPS